ncbi:alpha/beta fold hydrolase [Puteibacter caeruleilacunae]|nr:alpha/beta fold hydrolase [Puteibacter caeruleilacunae]
MQLNYRKIGETGPCIVVLHGLYGSSDNWMSIGRQLSKTHQVYLLDLRNHGRSFHEAEHSYETMVADLAWFFQEEELDQAILIGHSMGGKVVMKFAADYPEYVRSIVVVDIAPKNYMDDSLESGQYGFHRHLIRTMLGIDLSDATSLKDVDEKLSAKIPDVKLRQFLLKNITRNSERRYVWRINLKALDQWLDEIVSGVDYAMFADRMPILNYRALFLRGGNSPYIQEEDEDRIKAIYPEAQIITINDAGHWLHAEQPMQLIDNIKSFI